MLRRTKSEPAETAEAAPVAAPASGATTAGKGRPTPSRKQAEAERKARARATVDSKAARKQQREKRADAAKRQREGMKQGDEKYLLARDKGPVKKLTRDFVDARLSLAELLLPILIVSLVLNSSGSAALVGFGSTLMTTSVLVVFVDTAFAVWRLKRVLRAELPDESLKGVTFYAVMRMLQIRPTRIPKPRVRIGGRPK
ncbi:DUF3043 domain-containing protein [Nocardioides marmoraquaticus]